MDELTNRETIAEMEARWRVERSRWWPRLVCLVAALALLFAGADFGARHQRKVDAREQSAAVLSSLKLTWQLLQHSYQVKDQNAAGPLAIVYVQALTLVDTHSQPGTGAHFPERTAWQDKALACSQPQDAEGLKAYDGLLSSLP